jgi:hypothetical protein
MSKLEKLMKLIRIYQRGTETLELLDDDDTELTEYQKEISKFFKSSNVSIIETSSCSFVGKPSQVTGITVEEVEVIKDEDDKQEDSQITFEVEDKEPVEQDIITDMD